MTGVAELHEGLLGIESAARKLLAVAYQVPDHVEVPVPLAFAMIGLRESLDKMDRTREAVDAERGAA